MRRLTLSLAMGGALAACLAIGVTGSARAATLDFTGTLTVELGPWSDPSIPEGFVPARVTASGAGAALVNGSASGGHLNSLALSGGTFGPVTTSLSPIIGTFTGSIRFTSVQNLSGSFTGLSGGPPGGGFMGLQGLAKICWGTLPPFACDSVYTSVPLAPTTGGAGFGIGGTQTVPGNVAFTMHHAPWTIGQPVMTLHTPNSTISLPALPGGFAHGPASLTSSTAQPSGVVQLVTVSKVYTSLASSIPEGEFIGILTLHFVPEPSALLLVGFGVAALAVYGRRRHRR